MAKTRYFLANNIRLSIGLLLIFGLLSFWAIGSVITDIADADPISGPPSSAPSWKYWLGTDAQGRQMLPRMVAGVPITLRVGFIVGALGVFV